MYEWMDKIIEAQKHNTDIMKEVCHPFTVEEVCNSVTENNEEDVRKGY